MVLVTALLLLVVVTLIALAMFRSVGLDQKMAANLREKQRALERGPRPPSSTPNIFSRTAAAAARLSAFVRPRSRSLRLRSARI